MKKFLSILLCSLLIVPLSGCSNKILEVYPEIEQDFDKSDFDTLTELSEDYSLSYEELKENYAVSLLPDFKKSVEDNDLGVVTLDNIFSDNEYSYVVYSVEKEMEWGNPTANLTFKIDKENNINTIEYTDNRYPYDDEIINIIEGNNIDDERGHNTYELLSSEHSIENNIYQHGNNNEKYYYLPLNDDTIQIYANENDIPEGYVSSNDYWDNTIRKADKDLDKLKNNIDDVEDAFNTMDDAMRASN